MAVTLSISITQNSQNVANNTSSVTVNAIANWGYGSWNQSGECYGSITIDGTAYSFSNLRFNAGQTTSGSEVVMTKTVNVNHNTDGTKTLSCSASFYTGLSSSGTQTASGSKMLTTIPRASEFSVSNGTLGVAQTITVTRKSTNYTHTLTWESGSYSGTIVNKVTDAAISFTPSLNLANGAPYGTQVWIGFTLTTYSGNTPIGSVDGSIYAAIPDSVKPSCTVSVTDPTNYKNTYGGFVQGRSTMQITVTPTIAYSSPIDSYSVSADGQTYNEASKTTGVIRSGSNFNVTATVKDKRGRTSNQATCAITVVPYSKPTITKLTVIRCDSNGVENAAGSYAKVTYSHSISSLSNKNGKIIKLKYKKTSESTYTEVTLTSEYSRTDGTQIFAADDGSSYDIQLSVQDNFETVTQTTSVSTGFSIMHLNASGRGICFGGISDANNFAVKNIPVAFDKQLTMTGGRKVHSAVGASGTQGWVKVAEIQFVSNYLDQIMYFEIIRRGDLVPAQVYLKFTNSANTDTTIESFKGFGWLDFSTIAVSKISTSLWGLYVYKTGPYDHIEITDFSFGGYLGDRIKVTFTDQAITAFPSTAYNPYNNRIMALYNTASTPTVTFSVSRPTLVYSYGSNYGSLMLIIIPKYTAATVIELAKENFTVSATCSNGTATVTITDAYSTKNRNIVVENYL